MHYLTLYQYGLLPPLDLLAWPPSIGVSFLLTKPLSIVRHHKCAAVKAMFSAHGAASDCKSHASAMIAGFLVYRSWREAAMSMVEHHLLALEVWLYGCMGG